MSERRSLAALPEAMPGAPNVILLIWDTVRAKSLSLYGHDRATTPNLGRIARGGVVFEWAIAPGSWTLPSHASMFTGYLPHQLSAGWTSPLDDERTTLAEVFRDAGYVTGGFSANVLYAEWEHGLARGFIHYEDYPIAPGQVILSTSIGRRIIKGQHGWEHGLLPRLVGYRSFAGRRRATSVDDEFLEWIDERGDRPFFAFLNYFDAHLPYDPPAPFDTLFRPARPATTIVDRARAILEEEGGFWDNITKTELAAQLAAYEASIAYLDSQLRTLFDELSRRELLDSTIILITSDHGEEFLEHGGHEHGSNLYLPQIHVPLVVLYPGHVPANVRVEEPVSLRDVAATIASLSDVPGGDVFPGKSLETHWTKASTVSARGRRPVLSELVPGLDRGRRLHSLIIDRHHYIRNVDGRGELYDFLRDPDERRDLALEPDRRSDIRTWEQRLQQLLACNDALGPVQRECGAGAWQ